MINILHLTDLHFGYDSDPTARAQRAGALDPLVKELARLKPDWKPQILVISGDLTWRGKPAGYDELSDWLTGKLFPATGLTWADSVVCPGNHDLDRDATLSLLDPTLDPRRPDAVLRPERLASGFALPFARFVKFAVDRGIPAPLLHGAPNHLAGARELQGIRFVCLNSAWFCRDNDDRGKLWLGLPQLQSMGLSNPCDYDSAPLTVALVHHPQDWFTSSETTAYGDRPASYEFLATRAHAILSGHTHGAIQRATRYYDRAYLFLGGATYDNQAYRNNFSLLRIDPDRHTISRRPWEYDPRSSAWEEKAEQEYSLRAEKSIRGAHSPAKYLAWLRDQTQFIDLHQLKVGPGEVPPPAIDVLYIRLKSSARGVRRTKGSGLLEKALQDRRLVVEGKPGGGKTTFARWIAWMLCRPAGPPPDFPVRGFPLLIRVSEMDAHIAKTLEARSKGDPTQEADSRWIAHFLASRGLGLDEEFFRETLGAPDTILLLDGLDEAASQPRRERIVQTIQLAARQFGCQIVVTTRPGAHEGRATLTGFGTAFIEDLDRGGIEGFLWQWCHWLKSGDEPTARRYYDELLQAVAVSSSRPLVRNPLMLTALAVLHLRRHRLPEQRAQLYEQIMDWLAEQAVEKHGGQWRKDDLLARFGTLALAMQEWKGGQKVQIGIDTAAQIVVLKGEPIEAARRFLEDAQIVSGIVTLRGRDIVFWHRSFQEYLAARTLAGFPDAKLWTRSRKFLYSPGGREVLPLLAGHMAGSARERLDALLEDLTRHAVSNQTLERQAHAVGVLGNMLTDLAPTTYKLTEPAADAYGALRASVMPIFEEGNAGSLSLVKRVAAAEALDQASQSRLRLPGDNGYWIEIPGGTFTIGGDSEAFQSLPGQHLAVPAFRIGKFPVTVWEYGEYLEDTGADGFDDWDEMAAHPGHPVTLVTWHEAQAYCDWASRRWKIRCMLPTEVQWEFAARGKEGRIYPWGPEAQEPDEHHANFNSMVGEPTPVGMFPDGSTPEGVADMAGNVWEWMRSDTKVGGDVQVLRGGCFSYDARKLRACYRHGIQCGYRSYFIGFRCVRQ